MPRRNRALTLLLIPITIFIWCIGWGLYVIGSKKESTKLMAKSSVQQGLVIFVPTIEQNYADLT